MISGSLKCHPSSLPYPPEDGHGRVLLGRKQLSSRVRKKEGLVKFFFAFAAL